MIPSTVDKTAKEPTKDFSERRRKYAEDEDAATGAADPASVSEQARSVGCKDEDESEQPKAASERAAEGSE